MNRYDRQLRVPQIGTSGQRKIQNAAVMVVGCGALGTYSAEQLVRTGVRKLILIDPDHVEESNLQRQTLFSEADAKNRVQKVTAAKTHLKAIDSSVEILALPLYFDQAIFKELDRIDLVLDCTDNFQVRGLINLFCMENNLPFIFSACAGTNGQVMAIHPIQGPCLSCIFPNLQELEAKDCQTIGVVTPLVPLISSLQISLALKVLINDPSLNWQSLFQIDLWEPEITTFKIQKQKSCPVCGNAQRPPFTQKRKVKKTCGDAIFQGILPRVELQQLRRFCQQNKLTYKQNELACQIFFDEKQVTIFKSGKTLFYGCKTCDQAQALFDDLQTLTPRKDGNDESYDWHPNH